MQNKFELVWVTQEIGIAKEIVSPKINYNQIKTLCMGIPPEITDRNVCVF